MSCLSGPTFIYFQVKKKLDTKEKGFLKRAQGAGLRKVQESHLKPLLALIITGPSQKSSKEVLPGDRIYCSQFYCFPTFFFKKNHPH